DVAESVAGVVVGTVSCWTWPGSAQAAERPKPVRSAAQLSGGAEPIIVHRGAPVSVAALYARVPGGAQTPGPSLERPGRLPAVRVGAGQVCAAVPDLGVTNSEILGEQVATAQL